MTLHLHATLFQHGRLGAATLLDNTDAIAWAANDLGITSSYWNDVRSPYDIVIDPNVLNVVVEWFGHISGSELLRAIDAGARVALIASERPTPGRWNNEPGLRATKRWEWFRRVAPKCEALWCFVPGAADVLKRYNPNAAQLEVGYSASRAAATEPDTTEPEFDVGFFGGLTDRRKNVLRYLTAKGYSVHTLSRGDKDLRKALDADYGDRTVRQREMRRCKVMIYPLPFEWNPAMGKAGWGIFSASRGVTAMHDCMRPIVSEPTPATPWRDVATFAEAANGFALTKALGPVIRNWKDVYAEQFAKFKTQFAPERTLLPCLEATGVLAPRPASNTQPKGMILNCEMRAYGDGTAPAAKEAA